MWVISIPTYVNGEIMGKVFKYIELIFDIVLFTAAIWVSITLSKSYLSMLNGSKNGLNNNILSEQSRIVDEDIVSSSELIATLFYELDYDVQIDDLLISKYDHIEEFIGIYNINNKLYKRSYSYDINGSVTRVIYTSIESV